MAHITALAVLLSTLLVLASSLTATAQVPFPGVPRCTLIANLKPNKVLSSNLGGDSARLATSASSSSSKAARST
ncbi:hypothetical protein CLOP_g25259 [Closterium sp. NIES-67]|nr:hypothetical protein CLOP_g25259 [Closterium sp. NIES-67]